MVVCELGLNVISLYFFFCWFIFRFQEITHAKIQVFLNQSTRTRPGGKCALRWFYCLEKQKFSLVWKGQCQEKLRFHTHYFSKMKQKTGTHSGAIIGGS